MIHCLRAAGWAYEWCDEMDCGTINGETHWFRAVKNDRHDGKRQLAVVEG